MNEKEINELAAWTAAEIRRTVLQEGRLFDAAGEDILCEFVRSCLLSQRRGDKISLELCAKILTDIFTRRQHETQTQTEVMNAMLIFGSKFPTFVADNQRERDAEAAQIAASLPAIKV
ncbi:MAG: hypothetical protein IKN27_01735 [Selenomonadaceae bacterium]|nr:hypothetical protein [Selenomonadaceae bacterium]